VHRVFLASCLAGSLLVLPGCTWLWGTASSGGATAEEQAGADIRDPTPAIEAFYAENRTYAGVTTTGPRTTYDAQVPDVRIVVTSRDSYCIEMTGERQTYAARGPSGDVGVGPAERRPPTAYAVKRWPNDSTARRRRFGRCTRASRS